MKLENKTYDVLKKVALIMVPFITFIAALMEIWQIPYAAQITATLAALDTFLGALLHISSANYYDNEDEE